ADCLTQAVRKKQLERAFSAPVSEEVRASLAAQIEHLPKPAPESVDGEE
ncbi:MAG: DUF448 domain-containing protein, partial [Clostridia bacterium]|nr:DUF448 domain-containing protein [Clostridia bacterium]